MKYTIPIKEKMVSASSTMSISPINASKVCKVLNRKKFSDAKNTLEKIVKEEISIKGKYYTKTAEEILKLLEQLENNAKTRDLDPTKMTLFVSAHRGSTIFRSRRKRKHGMQLKMANMQAVLSEENGFGKKIREGSNKK